MGEERTEAYERHTVRDAADILGITTGAVRSRLSRRTLRSERVEGTVYVLLPRQRSGDMPADMLADELRDRLAFVERQLEAERQAHAEARRIIAGLVERIPPAIEPPEVRPDVPSGARGSPETASEGPGEAWGTSQREAAERPEREEEPRQRSWWREFFGFD